MSAAAALAARLEVAREATLALVEPLDDAALCAQPDPSFSPIGWHLGHVAFTEAEWILARCGGDASLVEPYRRRWAQNGCAKRERVHQPPKPELLGYLREVRERVLELLPTLDLEGGDPLLAGGFVVWLVEAHEHQHRETIAIVRRLALEAGAPPPPPPRAGDPRVPAIELEGGEVVLGTDDRLAYDNERPAHTVPLAPYAIDATPVTVGAWEAFRADGGYARPELWSEEGWAWRAREDVRWPRGWTRSEQGELARVCLDGTRALSPDEPVVGVSYYEAEAFARWRGARLPTEAEWEHAARILETSEPHLAAFAGPRPVRAPDLLGNVWEWTASAFAPYPGFAAFPYRGYSEPYFDGVHRVLRGGSFATHPRIATPTFRNWYEPWARAIFAGLRCARPLR